MPEETPLKMIKLEKDFSEGILGHLSFPDFHYRTNFNLLVLHLSLPLSNHIPLRSLTELHTDLISTQMRALYAWTFCVSNVVSFPQNIVELN
eukprot:c49663_g1_i1 orf=1-273(-)